MGFAWIDRVTELTYGRDWYSMLAKDRTYGQVAPAGVKPEAGEYVNKGVETSMHWDETGDVGDWLPVTDEDAGVGLKENILWAEDSLHLRMPWLYTATRFVTERYYAGDINGDYDQYDTRLTGSALESMQGRSVYFADEKLRVYTPGIDQTILPSYKPSMNPHHYTLMKAILQDMPEGSIRLRWPWLVGMKDRGQVGVYLMKGRAKGIFDSLA